MNAGRFFTFPLPLLYPMEPPKRTLFRILSFCVADIGVRSAADLDEGVAEKIIERCVETEGFDEDDALHRQIVLGCERLNASCKDIDALIEGREGAIEIVNLMEKAIGASPLVFIGAELFWECYRGEMPYREFTVLCAVNSVIGQKTTPQLIRRTLLLARAAGFKKPTVYGEGCCKRLKPRPMLTVSQLRWTLDKLEKRGLIARVQASPRSVFFSKGEPDKLRRAVCEMVRKRGAGSISARRKQDKEAMSRARGTTTQLT